MTTEDTPDATTGAAAGAGPLDLLLVLQDIDTEISQLHHRRASLPARSELAAADAARATLEERSAAVSAERGTLAGRQGEIEQQISAVNARVEVLEQRLYGARGAAARDLQAIDEEITHLRRRRGELEDTELEVMVAVEPLDAALDAMDVERARLAETAATLGETVRADEAEIDAALAERSGARAAAAASVPAELLERYETLRARLGGTGAARLVGGRCDGCHLALPSMEVDRIRRLPPGSVVTCDQCGRILVPGAPPA